MESQLETMYVGTGPFVCETCRAKWKTLEELTAHNKTPLHLVEKARRDIDTILTGLEDKLQHYEAAKRTGR